MFQAMAYNLLTIKKVKTDDIAEPHPDHQKSGPRTLEKVDPITKFTMMAKNSFLIIPRLLISNMTTVFQVQFQKYPNKAILIPNLFF